MAGVTGRRLWTLLGLAALVVGSNLWNPLGLHQNDEDYYFGVARDMARHGAWVVPTWFGEPTFVKPPLLYWMMRVSMAVFGDSYFAARLPVAVCAVVCVWLTWRLGQLWFADEDVALGAAAMLVGSFGFYQYGRVGMMDMPLTLCWLVVLWGTWEAWTGGAAAAWYACALGMGAAVLLKGPIGFIVPVGAWVLWWLLGMVAKARVPGDTPDASVGDAQCVTHFANVQHNARHPRELRVRGLSFILFLGLVAFWPLLLAMHGLAGTAWHEFIVVENAGKFVGGRNSVGGMLSGFAVLALPWTPLLLVALLRVLVSGQWREPRAALLLSFVIANVGAYSLPAIKWAQYLLPSLPVLCLLTAWQLYGVDAKMRSTGAELTSKMHQLSGPWRWTYKIVAALTALAVLAFAALLALSVFVLPIPELRIGLFFLAVTLAVLALGLVNGPQLQWAGYGAAGSLVVLAWMAPTFSMDRVPPNLAAVTADRPLYVYDAPPYRYAVALDRDVKPAGPPQQFKTEFDQGGRVIMDENAMNELMSAHVLLQTEASMDLCWRKWRRHMVWADIGRAIKAGDLTPMTENICVLEKRAR